MFSTELINAVKEMCKGGKKLREISCHVGISISSVQWILRDSRKTMKCKTAPKYHVTKCYALHIRRYIYSCNE